MLTEGVFESGHGAQSGRSFLAYSPGVVMAGSRAVVMAVANSELRKPAPGIKNREPGPAHPRSLPASGLRKVPDSHRIMFWQYWGMAETFSAGDGVPAAPQHGVG
jgi:hypothetical protein